MKGKISSQYVYKQYLATNQESDQVLERLNKLKEESEKDPENKEKEAAYKDEENKNRQKIEQMEANNKKELEEYEAKLLKENNIQ